MIKYDEHTKKLLIIFFVIYLLFESIVFGNLPILQNFHMYLRAIIILIIFVIYKHPNELLLIFANKILDNDHKFDSDKLSNKHIQFIHVLRLVGISIFILNYPTSFSFIFIIIWSLITNQIYSYLLSKL